MTGVEANNDLYTIDNNICRQTLKTYPLVYQLFQKLENFTAIVDGGRWPAYMTAGGVISGVTTHSTHDAMDLDARPGRPNGIIPGMKAGIINQAWTGINYPYAKFVPHFLVGQDLATRWKYDPCSKFCVGMPSVTITDTLEEAMDKARAIMGADRFLIFDGSTSFINCSPEVAESLRELAPGVEEMVLNELYPKYMKQRGLEP